MQSNDQTCIILPWPRDFAPIAGALLVHSGGLKGRSVSISLAACSYDY
jgi:hypothetical protein